MLQIGSRRLMDGVMLVNRIGAWTKGENGVRKVFTKAFRQRFHQHAVCRADVAKLLFFVVADKIILSFMFRNKVVNADHDVREA